MMRLLRMIAHRLSFVLAFLRRGFGGSFGLLRLPITSQYRVLQF